jgi:hypothetical protein
VEIIQMECIASGKLVGSETLILVHAKLGLMAGRALELTVRSPNPNLNPDPNPNPNPNPHPIPNPNPNPNPNPSPSPNPTQVRSKDTRLTESVTRLLAEACK